MDTFIDVAVEMIIGLYKTGEVAQAINYYDYTLTNMRQLDEGEPPPDGGLTLEQYVGAEIRIKLDAILGHEVFDTQRGIHERDQVLSGELVGIDLDELEERFRRAGIILPPRRKA